MPWLISLYQTWVKSENRECLQARGMELLFRSLQKSSINSPGEQRTLKWKHGSELPGSAHGAAYCSCQRLLEGKSVV